ncbi:MAG: leucine-rich repeat domain-containing protein [Muribaculum intestinale]|nr:leucine-rich repeat domain-containing protein [Muribaculum intestinale]
MRRLIIILGMTIMCIMAYAYRWDCPDHNMGYGRVKDAPYFKPYTCAMWGETGGLQVKVRNIYMDWVQITPSAFKTVSSYQMNLALPAQLRMIPFEEDAIPWETCPSISDGTITTRKYDVLSLAKIEPRPYERVRVKRCHIHDNSPYTGWDAAYYIDDDATELRPVSSLFVSGHLKVCLDVFTNPEYEMYWGFESVELPEGLIHIGDSACENVVVIDSTLVMPSTLEYIGDMAFYCGDFDIDLSRASSLTHIGVKAMYAMSAKEIVLPESLEEVGEMAFGPALSTQKVLNYTGSSDFPYVYCNECTSYLDEKTYREYTKDVSYQTDLCLSKIVSMNPTPPKVVREYKRDETTGELTDELMREEPLLCHEEFAGRIPLYVPSDAVEAYRSAPGWKNFTRIYPLSELSGIDDIRHNGEPVETGRYDMSGRKVDDNYRGVVVVRYSDGSARKELH